VGDWTKVCGVLLLAGALCASGCGASSSAQPPAPPPRLTQAEFVAKASALCWRFARDTRSLNRRLEAATRQRNLERLSLLFGESIPTHRQFVFQLSRLKPPLRRERGFQQLIQLENKQLAYIRAAYLTSGTYAFPQLLTIAKRSQRVAKREDALARSLGLTGACTR
jgi:hypothetical protein